MKSALDRLRPAIGDGKIIQVHQYVLHKGDRLYVTDGRSFASAPVTTDLPPFCVHAEGLSKALTRDGAKVNVSDNGNIVVRYGSERGRLILKPRAVDDMPMLPLDSDAWHAVPEGFRNWVRILKDFVGSPDGQPWSTCIHFGTDFSFAASNRAACRSEFKLGIDGHVMLPTWAIDFVLTAERDPIEMADERNSLLLRWSDGVVLRTQLVSESPPENVWTLVSGLSEIAEPVPEGLKDALSRALEHSATVVSMGEGSVSASFEHFDMEEDVAIAGSKRHWPAPLLAQALQYADRLDLSGSHALWSGASMRGIVAGMS